MHTSSLDIRGDASEILERKRHELGQALQNLWVLARQVLENEGIPLQFQGDSYLLRAQSSKKDKNDKSFFFIGTNNKQYSLCQGVLSKITLFSNGSDLRKVTDPKEIEALTKILTDKLEEIQSRCIEVQKRRPEELGVLEGYFAALIGTIINEGSIFPERNR